MHFDLLTCIHALLKDLNYELLHTFAQHDKAENVPHSSILPLTRRIDGDVTVSNSEVDSNVMAPYALNFCVTFEW